MISSLIDCAQTGFARPLTHSEMEKIVHLYLQDGFAPETVMLCVAYVASKGKRTMAAVTHELKVWRAEGVETGEQADAHLKLLALRAQREQYVSGLLGIPDSELTLGGRKAIARWYEVYGYDDAMVQEVAVQAGPKRDLWYWNSILKTWNAKGLRTIHDVRGPVAEIGASRNIRVDRTGPQRKRFSQEFFPHRVAQPPEKEIHAVSAETRSLYAYQKRTVSGSPAHHCSPAADRPGTGGRRPRGGGGRDPGFAPRGGRSAGARHPLCAGRCFRQKTAPPPTPP